MCILSVSQSLSVRLSRDEMDDDDCGWGREKGGRERRIIPSEYMMNVFIRLKLTWGGVSGVQRQREHACEWHRALSSALPCGRSQSLYPLPKERQRKSRKLKEYTYTAFLSLVQPEAGGQELRDARVKRNLSLAAAHPELFTQQQAQERCRSVRSAWRGQRMLNNMTDCEEGEGGPNSQGEWRNLLPSDEKGVCMCVWVRGPRCISLSVGAGRERAHVS